MVKYVFIAHSVEAYSSGSRWVINGSDAWQVASGNSISVPNYLVPDVCILFYNGRSFNKFALWKFLLPVTGRRPAKLQVYQLLKNAPLVSNTGLMISVTGVHMVDRNYRQ